MKFFIDTANVEEIKEVASWGIIDGVTTNPSLIAKEGRVFKDVIKEITSIVDGPISAEVVSLKSDDMVKEAIELVPINKNIVIKLPMTKEGLKACKQLSDKGVKTNVTLIFSASQALMAAKAGATYVSPFLGRLDDISSDGMILIEDIVEIFTNYDIRTEIICASVRHPIHLIECAKVGADIATVPYKVFEQMLKHPLTDIGIDKFLKDWESVKDL
ncbi:fructose-6-phosphate aldolase [Peptostreptococcaceae bacterium OttesenSCG-928-C18]|nr:fructose-6-phosphate aldolase [Peptostreptococcaceae bacterium OttesenSCG-928-C18]